MGKRKNSPERDKLSKETGLICGNAGAAGIFTFLHPSPLSPGASQHDGRAGPENDAHERPQREKRPRILGLRDGRRLVDFLHCFAWVAPNTPGTDFHEQTSVPWRGRIEPERIFAALGKEEADVIGIRRSAGPAL